MTEIKGMMPDCQCDCACVCVCVCVCEEDWTNTSVIFPVQAVLLRCHDIDFSCINSIVPCCCHYFMVFTNLYTRKSKL